MMRALLIPAAAITLLMPVQQTTSPPQQTPAPQPPTEVFLAPVDAQGTLTSWTNISNNPGYDNQPSFLPDGSGLLFTSNRDGKQTDIYRYDIAAKTLTQLTKTPESEYSPLVTPDRRSFSVIRVEADNTQRLWRFDLDGSNPRLVLENVKPVGYHAWIDATHLALFVLGSPNTLQIADTGTGTAEVVATGVGRSILVRPRTGTVSFMTTAQPRMIKEFDPKTRTTTDLVAPYENSQDAVWTNGGVLLMAAGRTIGLWRPGRTEWQTFAMLDGAFAKDGAQPIVGSVTRLALSPNNQWLAFVAEPLAK